VLLEHLNANPQLRRDGLVRVVGWTRDAPAPLRTRSGRDIEVGRTGFVTVARIDPAIGGSSAFTIVRGWESTDSTIDPIGPNDCVDGALTLLLTAVDPLDTDDAAALAVSTRSVAALDVWVGDEWVPAGIGDLDADPVIALPGEAIDGGAALVRLVTNCEAFGRADAAPTLRAAGPDETLVALGATDEEATG
jgi:hypothetical protein